MNRRAYTRGGHAGVNARRRLPEVAIFRNVAGTGEPRTAKSGQVPVRVPAGAVGSMGC